MKHFIIIFLLVFSPASFAGDASGDVNNKTELTPTPEVEVRPWWIGDLLTVLSIFAGIGLIVFQLNRQHKNDIEAQKESHRDQLRLEVYQEFSLALENTNNKTLDSKMYASFLTSNVINYLHQINIGTNPQPLKARALEFSNVHFASYNSIVRLIKLIEKYEIVSPELHIFQIAFNSSSHNISEAFTPLYQFLLRFLPMDITDNAGNPQIVNILTPTQEQIDELQTLVNNIEAGHDELGGYLFDLNVELQKLFLSRLFDNSVKIREPIDPNVKVITTTQAHITELKQYFENETPWGINIHEVEERVRNEFNNP